MPFPFILIGQIIVSFTTGACIGKTLGCTVNGISNLSTAQSLGNDAAYTYHNSHNRLKFDVDRINSLVEKYGEIQLEAWRTISAVYNLVDSQSRILESFSVSLQNFEPYQMTSVDSGQIVCAGAGAATEAAIKLAASTLVKGIQTIGFQDTLKSLGLYGVKATTAKVFAASTSGLALGSVFGFLLPPALAAMGSKFADDTEQVLTDALEYKANVDIEVTRINCFREKLSLVEARLLELHDGVYSMTEWVKQGLQEFSTLSNDRRNRAIHTLNSTGRTRLWKSIWFTIRCWVYNCLEIGNDPKDDLKDIDMLRLLLDSASCLAVVLSKATVLDEDGQLCSDSLTLFEQYRL